MTDKKISELTSITGANVNDTTDELAIVDASTNTTKAITREELFQDVLKIKVGGGADGGANADELVASKDQTNVGISILSEDSTGNSRILLGTQTDTSAAKVQYIASSDEIILQSGGIVTLQSGGTNDRVTIDSSGNVGIGNSSPSAPLDVTGTVTADGLTVNKGSTYSASTQTIAEFRGGDNSNSTYGAIEVGHSASSRGLQISGGRGFPNGDGYISIINSVGTVVDAIRIQEGGDISFYEDTGTTPKFFWDASAESLGIGTTSPSSKLDVNGSITTDGLTSSDPLTVSRNADNMLVFDNTGASDDWTIKVVDTDDTMRFAWGAGDIYHFESGGGLASTASVVRRGDGDSRYLQLSGGTLTGDTTVNTGLKVGTGADGGGTGDELVLSKDQNNVGMSILAADASGVARIYFGSQTDTTAASIRHSENLQRLFVQSQGDLYFQTTGNSTIATLNSSGDLDVTGALSKGSGSFKIDHPLKPDTHHLVHSFIEGPQADNIYRGTVALVNGAATVNLDEAGRMTGGTFVALNGNVQCFTSNEQGWTAVRGSVSGNILTIEAQDVACTDTVSWMVIGERHDQHMIDTAWTDAQGRVITEPKKVEDTQEEAA